MRGWEEGDVIKEEDQAFANLFDSIFNMTLFLFLFYGITSVPPRTYGLGVSNELGVN